MTRAHRLGVEGGVFHLTHRCHNRAFLMRYVCDREAYREKVRQKLKSFDLSLLDYCVTCNHVHLMVDASDRLEVGAFIREVDGEFARAYNHRKRRRNAFWGDNYHATLVDTGTYLQRCLCYIELNMVRCGVVGHPDQWRWQGYQEIMGKRRRYRLLDLERLCWRLNVDRIETVREHLQEMLHDRMARDVMRREPHWTESLAVGSKSFVEHMKPFVHTRRETDILEHQPGTWVLKEAAIPYKTKTDAKPPSKP